MQTNRCDESDLHMQILLVGDSGVGKSSLLMRFTAGQFEESSVPTIGAKAPANCRNSAEHNTLLYINSLL